MSKQAMKHAIIGLTIVASAQRLRGGNAAPHIEARSKIISELRRKKMNKKDVLTGIIASNMQTMLDHVPDDKRAAVLVYLHSIKNAAHDLGVMQGKADAISSIQAHIDKQKGSDNES